MGDDEVIIGGEAVTRASRENHSIVVGFKSLNTWVGTNVFFHSSKKCAAFTITLSLHWSLTVFLCFLYSVAAESTSQAVSKSSEYF